MPSINPYGYSPLASALSGYGGGGYGGMGGANMMMMGAYDPSLLMAQPQLQLGSSLMQEGVNAAPIYSPWQGLSRLAGLLVGQKIMKDAYGGLNQGTQETPEQQDAMVKLFGGPNTPAGHLYLTADPITRMRMRMVAPQAALQQSNIEKVSPGESVGVGANASSVPNPVGPTDLSKAIFAYNQGVQQGLPPDQLAALRSGVARDAQAGGFQLSLNTDGTIAANMVPGGPATPGTLYAQEQAKANAGVGAATTINAAKAAAEGAQTRATNLSRPDIVPTGDQRIVPPQVGGVAGGGGGGYASLPPPSGAAPVPAPAISGAPAASAPVASGFPKPKPIAPTVAAGETDLPNGVRVPNTPAPTDADGNPLAVPVNPQASATPAPTTAGQPPVPPKAAAPLVKTAPLPGGGTVTQFGTNASTFQPLIEEDTKELMGDRENAAKGQTDMATARSIMQFLPTVKTGWGAPQIQEASKILSSLGVSNDDVAKFTGTNPAMGDYLTKQFLNLSMGAARNMGAREPGSVIQMFSKAYPNLGTTQEALQLQSNAIYMDRQRAQDLANAKTDWLNDSVNGIQSTGNYRGLKGFNEEFNKTHSAESYLYGAEAMAGHPEAWRGAKTPEQQDMVYNLIPSGTAFLAPDGHWRVKP